MKISFFGTPQNAAIILKKLLSSKHKPSLVVTGADIQRGRGRKFQSSPIKELARDNDLKILEPGNLTDKNFIKDFSNFSPDLAILIAYGKLIPKVVLAIPKFGFVNIHPSLLPKYRGPSPIYQTILNGDDKTGVTIIKLDEELDHGPILAQKELTVLGNETHQSLMGKLADTGSELLIDTLPFYLKGKLALKEQDHSKATYTEKITKADGFINLYNPPNPQTLDRMIRAFYPWPGVYTKLKIKNEKLKVIKFLPDSPFLIQPEGKKPMTVNEFLNGYPEAEKFIEKLLR